MKLIEIIKTVFVSTLVLISGFAQATDYYVSATGSDSNNGTSPSTPWKTITKVESVCNSGLIGPGDRVLFKCGDQFTGKAVIASIWGKNAKSGTASNPVTLGSYGTGAKPTFLYPTGGSTPAESRVLFWFAGLDYWVIDGLNFTDLDQTNNKVTPANLGIPLYLGSDVGCNHWTVQNVDISLCGMGIVLVGDYNTVQNCNLTNFKNLKSTPNTGGSTAYEDYGANPFTLLDGNHNTIKYNYVSGGWSESLDFGFNGGFCEMFGSCSYNTFMYNTIIDCNGLSEFGANGAAANSVDNLYAYNKLIDNGAMFYCNISGPFACQVGNVMFYNNTVIETNNSRFAQGSANAGAGVTSPEAISHINLDSYMFLYNGTPTASTVYALKNNIFNVSNPLKICRSSESRLTHDYEVFKLSGGSNFPLALNTHEVSTSAALFVNTTPANATAWDLNPLTGSAAIDRGTSVGINADFVGNPVPSVPNAGIYESASASVLAATATAGSISCNGGSTTVTVSASGGSVPYTGTGTFTVTAGTYNYTITDATGATTTTSIIVSQPTAVTAVASAGTIAVYGGTTTVTVTAGGGTPGYTYRINSGSYQSSNSFAGMAAGTHTITVKDANGCTKSTSVTITQPAPAQLIAAATATNISCNGGTATVTVSATGGVAPYTGTGDFTVSAGNYNYTVTDALGTTATTSITVSQPSSISLSLSSGNIAVFGGTTTLTANASGGTGTFTYKLNSGSYQASATFTGVAAGTHTVTAKDANGCTKTQTITITQPSQLAATSSATTIACNAGTSTVTVSATGGVTPYTGTGTFTVTSGTYTYTVTDANGATATTSVSITQPTAISLSVTSGTIAVYGGTTTITATATGGAGTYTFRLNSGTYQSANTFSNIAAGTYSVTAKDANGCTRTQSITITQPQAPAQLIATATANNIACFGGSATVTVSATGGVTPYTGTGTFSVSAGTYNYTVTDANGTTASTSITVTQPTAISVTIAAGTIAVYGGTTTVAVNAAGGTGTYTYSLNGGTFQSANTFNNVAAGNHAVTVKDENGCTSVKNFTLTQPPAPLPLVVTATAGTIGCNGGTTTVSVSATGGVTPYTGTGSFTVTAGTYTYTVTDANGTTSNATVTVSQPAAIVVTLSAGSIAVYGGTTTVTTTATGGTGAYTYQLDGGTYQSSSSFTGVAAGNHTVIVKDANGCSASQSISITQPAQNTLIVTATPTPILCNSAISTITVSAAGGTAPYTGTGLFTGYAGTYTYTVTDANGATASTTITITQPNVISISISAPAITTIGGTTTVAAAVTGGTAPYSYSLNGGNIQSSPVFSNLPAGAYTIAVKDANGCSKSYSFTLTDPGSANLRVSIVAKTNTTCKGSATGTVQVLALGGRAPYTYKLNNGRYTSNPLFKNLVAGVYRIYAKDANNNVVSCVTYIYDARTLCTNDVSTGKLGIVAYPNPSIDRFNLSINTTNDADVVVEVMNLNGTRVYQGKGSAAQQYVFGQNFPAGTYFVRVTQGKDVKTTTVIKGK